MVDRADGVFKHTLDNGLTVLLKAVHSAPIISWWVLYRVGSRNEVWGRTGISHWVEHMLFKGTARYPAGALDRMIDRHGGVWNAQTSMDYTAVFETMPAAHIDLALEAEADRMVGALFDPEAVEAERTVIISEREGAENAPAFWLREEMRAAAFRVHPYRHEILGEMADLRSITRDDLYAHYQRYYVPNNAIAVAVGDFDPDALLGRIEALYGAIPRGEDPPPVTRVEPPQESERVVHVEREGTTHLVRALYRVPEATHPDWIRLAVVDSILAGASAPGGDSIGNRTSRLYKALVEKELASGVGGGLYPSVDPYVFTVQATVRDGQTPEAVQQALDETIDRFADDVTQAELDKAKKQTRALFAYGTEGVTGQAFWLALSESLGSYTWYEGYVERLEAVTLDDVRTVARQYLRRSQRTVGWLIPLGNDGREPGR